MLATLLLVAVIFAIVGHYTVEFSTANSHHILKVCIPSSWPHLVRLSTLEPDTFHSTVEWPGPLLYGYSSYVVVRANQ